MESKNGRPPLENKYLLAKLEEASKIFGGEVTVKQLDSLQGFPSKTAYRKHFGGFNMAKVLVNIPINENYCLGRIPKSGVSIPNPQSRNISRKQRFVILSRDGFRCVYCGRTPTGDGVALFVDHIIPFSQGGLTVNENLCTACFDCNIGKSDLTLNSYQ
ncbi:MAG: HNH endonuclease [Elusimicrobiota bacterium]|nr:HNH endonuclease [Elusimicrobiota bacterium]